MQDVRWRIAVALTHIAARIVPGSDFGREFERLMKSAQDHDRIRRGTDRVLTTPPA